MKLLALAPVCCLSGCSVLITKAGTDQPDQEFLRTTAFAIATSAGVSEIIYTPGALINRVCNGPSGQKFTHDFR